MQGKMNRWIDIKLLSVFGPNFTQMLPMMSGWTLAI